MGQSQTIVVTVVSVAPSKARTRLPPMHLPHILLCHTTFVFLVFRPIYLRNNCNSSVYVHRLCHLGGQGASGCLLTVRVGSPNMKGQFFSEVGGNTMGDFTF